MQTAQMLLPQIAIGSLWAGFAAGMAWYIGRVAVEITYVTLADGRRKERRLPLVFRLLLPFAPNLTPLFRKARFARARETIGRRLVAAGFEELLDPVEFLALRVLVPLTLGPLLILLLRGTFTHLPGRVGAWVLERQWMPYLCVALLAYVLPALWLRSVLKTRHRSIQRALPFVLDLLTLSVEAGMDFMSAIRRIIERREVDAVGEELIRVLREVQVGKTRREALRDMAERVDQPDVRSVVHALIQADELGVSIGSILRVQADQMRNKRFARAEKLAHEAPVKMLFPLVLFIFPSVFIMLLGPIFLQIIRHGI
ncbi:MAG: type II secretion system F family protein [Kiritimatiellae bacterium]|nr:type II secretion system F family protein [Kiritimatiellia bacterium]